MVGVCAAALLSVAGASIAVWFGYFRPRVRAERQRIALMELLTDPDPAQRREGAWLFIVKSHPVAEAHMHQALRGDERDASVRAAYVFALASDGQRRSLPTFEAVLMDDDDGATRAAAWAGVAAVDAEQFRRMLADVQRPRDEWDSLGVAHGQVICGETAGVGRLLRFARDGTAEQRTAASLAITRDMYDVLRALGRWPLDLQPPFPIPLPAATVDALSARLANVALEAPTADLARHADAVRDVRHTVRRLTGGRERIVRVLASADDD